MEAWKEKSQVSKSLLLSNKEKGPVQPTLVASALPRFFAILIVSDTPCHSLVLGAGAPQQAIVCSSNGASSPVKLFGELKGDTSLYTDTKENSTSISQRTI